MFSIYGMFRGFKRSSGAEDLLEQSDVSLYKILELNDIDNDFRMSNKKVVD